MLLALLVSLVMTINPNPAMFEQPGTFVQTDGNSVGVACNV